jgi:site-specific DNA-methyltransferase (adenine-specific)
MKPIELWQGDCLELMKNIPDGSVDLVLTDPPYGTTACKWDSVIPFEPMWEQLNRIIKPNGAIVLFGSEPFSTMLRYSNLKMYRYDWYWNKNRPTNPMSAKKQPMKAVETISVFYKEQPLYNPQMTERTEDELKRLSKKSVYTRNTETDGRQWTKTANRNDNKLKYPINILTHNTVFNRSKEKTPHPTQKPVDLLEYLVRTYTNEGESVLDFTMGSGSTGVACVNTNRNFIGIELDEGYFNIAKKRIEEAYAD